MHLRMLRYIYIYIYIYIYMCVCVCVEDVKYIYIYIYIYISRQDLTQAQFLSDVLQVWMQSFFFLDWLPNQSWRTRSALLLTHSYRENYWFHTFPKGVSAMRNANYLVKNLNSGRRVHVLHLKPLHYERPLYI